MATKGNEKYLQNFVGKTEETALYGSPARRREYRWTAISADSASADSLPAVGRGPKKKVCKIKEINGS